MFNIQLDLLLHKDSLLTKTENGKTYIWDALRKNYFVLTPEETVRQLLIIHFLENYKALSNKLSVEKELKINLRKKRFDLLVYDESFKPYMLIECKAPYIEIGQSVLDQVAWYNVALEAPYLMVTNGMVSYCAKIDFQKKSYEFLHSLPFEEENSQ